MSNYSPPGDFPDVALLIILGGVGWVLSFYISKYAKRPCKLVLLEFLLEDSWGDCWRTAGEPTGGLLEDCWRTAGGLLGVSAGVLLEACWKKFNFLSEGLVKRPFWTFLDGSS